LSTRRYQDAARLCQVPDLRSSGKTTAVTGVSTAPVGSHAFLSLNCITVLRAPSR
jgi:hypothetical protein